MAGPEECKRERTVTDIYTEAYAPILEFQNTGKTKGMTLEQIKKAYPVKYVEVLEAEFTKVTKERDKLKTQKENVTALGIIVGNENIRLKDGVREAVGPVKCLEEMVVAQDKLLIAYRLGGQPPGWVLDSLSKAKDLMGDISKLRIATRLEGLVQKAIPDRNTRVSGNQVHSRLAQYRG